MCQLCKNKAHLEIIRAISVEWSQGRKDSEANFLLPRCRAHCRVLRSFSSSHGQCYDSSDFLVPKQSPPEVTNEIGEVHRWLPRHLWGASSHTY